MLSVQKYLYDVGGDLEALTRNFGIQYNRHDDGRVILNYHQIDSYEHRFHPVVKDCRALVLDSRKDFSLVARAFPRFYNWGENREDTKKFVFENSYATHKEDGSLILCYWKDGWHINTRGTFGDGMVNDFISWRDLFELARPPLFYNKAESIFCYVFELCSRYNKVVRDYSVPSLFLLSIYNGETELKKDIVDEEARRLRLNRPEQVYFNDIFDAEAYIANQARNDKTFEGVVLCDHTNLRIKVKSTDYLYLHKLANNGNLASPKSLIKYVVEEECDEIIAYFPELSDRINKMRDSYNKLKKDVDNWFYVHNDEPSQKKFALAVKNQKFGWVLFMARRQQKHPWMILRENYERVLDLL